MCFSADIQTGLSHVSVECNIGDHMIPAPAAQETKAEFCDPRHRTMTYPTPTTTPEVTSTLRPKQTQHVQKVTPGI
jgi:hypothetical protein